MQHQDQTQPLNTKQRAFVAAMLTSPSIVAAAREADIAEKTAHQWLKLPSIQDALDDAHRNLFNTSLSELRGAARQAIKTLTRHMTDDETPPHAQIRAAAIILEQSIALHKISELEKKIAELENLVKGKSA